MKPSIKHFLESSLYKNTINYDKKYERDISDIKVLLHKKSRERTVPDGHTTVNQV